MEKEKYFEEFLLLVKSCSKMSPFDQFFKYPKLMMEFFEKIYKDGYDAGHKAGEIMKKQNIMGKN